MFWTSRGHRRPGWILNHQLDRHDTVTQGSWGGGGEAPPAPHGGSPREFRREVCLLTTSSMQAIQAEPPRVRVRYISIRHHTCIRCVGCLLLGSSRGFKQEAKVPAGKSLCSPCLPARDVRITNTVSFQKKKNYKHRMERRRLLARWRRSDYLMVDAGLRITCLSQPGIVHSDFRGFFFYSI